jgi:hypothetical protein
MEKGADLSLKDTEQRSALHAAVGHGGAMETLCKVRFGEKTGNQHRKPTLFFSKHKVVDAELLTITVISGFRVLNARV